MNILAPGGPARHPGDRRGAPDDRRRVRPLDRLDGRLHRPRLRRRSSCSAASPLPLALVVDLRRSPASLGALNGQIVIRTRLPSFIVTLAFLFILRGLSLVGLKWATGGSTQLRGIGEQAGRGLRPRDLLRGRLRGPVRAGSPRHDLVANFPNGAADRDAACRSRSSGSSPSRRSPPGSCCARAPATGSSPPAAIRTRRAIPACR